MIEVVRVTETTKDEVKCDCCKLTKKKSIDFYEIHLSDSSVDDSEVLTVKMCDVCLDKLFYAALHGICEMNGRAKSKRDQTIAARRGTALRLNKGFQKELEDKRDKRKTAVVEEVDEDDPWEGIEDEEDEEDGE